MSQHETPPYSEKLTARIRGDVKTIFYFRYPLVLTILWYSKLLDKNRRSEAGSNLHQFSCL